MQGGFIWDWAEQNLRQPLVITPDSSRNGIQAFLVGKPGAVAGPARPGRRSCPAWTTSSTSSATSGSTSPGRCTLDAWVKPGEWAGSFPILTKGQGVRAADARRATPWSSASTPAAGRPAGRRRAGRLVRHLAPGHRRLRRRRPAPLHRRRRGGRRPPAPAPSTRACSRSTSAATPTPSRTTTCGASGSAAGLIDDARIYPARADPGAARRRRRPGHRAVLALDFDRFQRRGDFLSLGHQPVRHRRPGRLGPLRAAGDRRDGLGAGPGPVHRRRRGRQAAGCTTSSRPATST